MRDDIIRLANHFGADETYSRAGGGNASYKADGALHIKPSGVPLATLEADDLVPLRISTLLEALVSEEPVDGDPVMAAAAAARLDDGERRPSVEILFHALIEDPLVLHLHPLVTNALTCNEAGPELARELLGEEALWVDYVDPGVPLAREIASVREAFQQRTGRPAPSITLLGNHGVIVSGASFEEVSERLEWLTATIQRAIDASPAVPTAGGESEDFSALTSQFQALLDQDAVTWSTQDWVRQAARPEAGPIERGPLIPDQIVYSGSFPLVTDPETDMEAALEEFRERHGRDPIVAAIPGQGVIAVGKNEQAASVALHTFLDALRVARDADRLGQVRVLNERERRFIETWEAEAYRRQVADAD